MDSKDRQIEELKALVSALTKRVAELELALAKATKDSSTSSKSPSSDLVKPKPKKGPGRPKSTKLGAQPGHQRNLREPLPPERVDETFVYEIDSIEIQRLGLTPTGDYDVIQHIELPEVPVHVTDHRLTVYRDVGGNLFIPHLPELQVPVSRGYLAKLCTGIVSDSLARSMLTHRDRFLEVVRNPPSTKEAKNLAARFAIVEYSTDDSKENYAYDMSQDYFRFMFAEGVEPTNNHSEQQIRHCVIDRKITQGTHGELGQRYHERMWTAIATCKKQKRNFFSFLLESIEAKQIHQPVPTLLSA